MVQLIYTSIAHEETDLKQVQQILTVANTANKIHNVTGILLWDTTVYLQCIEGESHAIDQLFKNICQDERHHSIRLLGKVETAQRGFEEWSMAFVNERHLTQEALLTYTGATDFAPRNYNFSQALALLKSLSTLI